MTVSTVGRTSSWVDSDVSFDDGSCYESTDGLPATMFVFGTVY